MQESQLTLSHVHFSVTQFFFLSAIFAPSDEAFEALPAGVLDFLLRKDNVETLATVVRHHIVADFEISSANIVNNGGKVTTIDGDTLSILTMNQTTPTIGDSTGSDFRSTFASFDIPGTNGVTHLLDRVLIPGK